jgi:16S rRNA (guanine966-N2)-methyltransferase
LRVIAGEKRGTLLNSPLGRDIRPTYDRVREAVFGKLQFDIPGTTVLDLFAGSGAMGIEAMSRGAAFVYFVDRDENAIQTVRANVQKTKYTEKCKIIKNDYSSALNMFKNAIKFDIVFIDPPYASKYYDKTLIQLDENGVLNEKAVLVLESDEELEINLNNFEQKQIKKYGKTTITYMEYTK